VLTFFWRRESFLGVFRDRGLHLRLIFILVKSLKGIKRRSERITLDDFWYARRIYEKVSKRSKKSKKSKRQEE